LANVASTCSFGGTGITDSGANKLTLACDDGRWFTVSKADGSVVTSGSNGLDMFGLQCAVADRDMDGVADSDDACPDTAIPESVPTERLGTNRWALGDDDGVFDAGASSAGGSFTVDDTGGCSCEQIIDRLGRIRTR
jgi:hypothetical protein